jgi:hypothetical protein
MPGRRLEPSRMPLGLNRGGILQLLETQPCSTLGADTKDAATCGYGVVVEITGGSFAGFPMAGGLTILTKSS